MQIKHGASVPIELAYFNCSSIRYIWVTIPSKKKKKKKKRKKIVDIEKVSKYLDIEVKVVDLFTAVFFFSF